MRVHDSFPTFDVDATTKARFTKMLEGYSKETGAAVRIDSIDLKAVAHKWEFASEDEFDKASKLPEKIDELVIMFSDGDLRGLVCLGPNIAYGSWDGPLRLAAALQTAVDKFVREEYRQSVELSARTRKITAAAKQTFPVKQCELDADGLRALAASILHPEENLDVGTAALQFSASSGSLTLYEDSLDRILDNPSLPVVFSEFTVTSRGTSPRVSVTIRQFKASHVQVEGPQPWVTAKKMRLQKFFKDHPNSDPLGRSQALTAVFVILLCYISISMAGLTLNRFYWHLNLGTVLLNSLVFSFFAALFVGLWLSENVIPHSWVAASPRRVSLFRSLAGGLLVILATEVAYILVGLAAGWLSATTP